MHRRGRRMRTTMRTRMGTTYRGGVCCLLVASALASCGGGSGKNSASPAVTGRAGTTETIAPLAIVKQSIAATLASGSARVAHHLQSDITAFSANESSVGITNFKTGRGEWSHNMSGTPKGLVPDGTPPNQIVLQVREVDQYLYTSLPPAFAAAGIKETWLRVPVNPPAGTTGLTGFEGLSPRIPLSARFERPEVAFRILSTTSGARLVGPAMVRGKPTTRYSIDTKLRTMLDDVGLMFFFGNPTAPADLAKIDEVCAKAAKVDVFVDALGRIREVLIDADLRGVAPIFKPPQDPKFWHRLLLQWDFYDYGVSAPITAPTQSVRTSR
jgi:hypothetical protein